MGSHYPLLQKHESQKRPSNYGMLYYKFAEKIYNEWKTTDIFLETAANDLGKKQYRKISAAMPPLYKDYKLSILERVTATFVFKYFFLQKPAN